MKTFDRLYFSIIIPVYNRPEEIHQLLNSIVNQTSKVDEVIIVEDGSTNTCNHIIIDFEDKLNIKYFYKENSGPGSSRNYGYEKAKGNYCIFLDSDCILPQNYIKNVQKSLVKNYVDAYGGPDNANHDFSHWQKAINYSMTSYFTTGGIRGKNESLCKFQPRSFNMGYSRDVFNATKGFSNMRYGEDIDMSIRIIKHGFKTGLIHNAFVWHKRKSNIIHFIKQTYNFGCGRVENILRHPETIHIIHFLPTFFLLFTITSIIISIFTSWFFMFPLISITIIIAVDSFIKNKNPLIALLSIATSFIQILSYGTGFFVAMLSHFFKHLQLAKIKDKKD